MGATANNPYVQQKNIAALVLGTGEFSIAIGALTAAAALVAGYSDLGNMLKVQIKPSTSNVEHWGSYRGTLVLDDTVLTKKQLTYMLTADEWNMNILTALFYAGSQSAFTQGNSGGGGSPAATAQDGLAFTSGAGAAVIGRWYDITNSGVRVRNLTAVTVDTLTEGTDFVVDYKLGRIRFTAAHTATLTPTCTYPAITAGSASGYQYMGALLGGIITGFGRLTIYDQNKDNEVVLDHTDFACQLRIDGTAEADGTKFSDIQLMVEVLQPAGTITGRASLIPVSG